MSENKHVIPDPTEEIREIKRKLSAEFDFGVRRIAEETRRRQCESGREVVALPQRESTQDSLVSQPGE